MRRRRLLIGALLLAAADGVQAQGTWDAILTVDPYPTPYYSDWDSNPNIASLTLINSTAESQSVRIHFNVINHANRVVVSGASEPELIAAGATVIFDNPYDVAGSTTHDQEMEEVAARTGRMPEGDYTACATATDGSGFVLAESCAPFSIVYPDPPLLLGPFEGEVLNQPDPLFMWTPVQVPIDYQLTYVLRVVEVLPDQSAAAALRENIPHYETLYNTLTSLRYPIDAQPLEEGRRYAWAVQALDQNGYAAAGNDGRSEIWTFVYGEDADVPTSAGGMLLTMSSTAGDDTTPSVGRRGLADICRGIADYEESDESPPPAVFTVDLNVDPAFLPGSTEFPVKLYHDTATADWALLQDRGDPGFLLYGNCREAFGPLGGLRWIARRANVGDLGMPIDTATFATEWGWRFGVLILSFGELTAGDMPEGFVEPRKFMEDHSVKVKPGINVFGIVDVPAGDDFRTFLQAVGYDDAYVQLQGFLGVQNTFSVNGTIGHTAGDSLMMRGSGAGAAATLTVLALRASLPRRQPVLFSSAVEWMQPTVELTGKVKGTSTWVKRGSGAEWIGGKVELELGASVTAMFADGIERSGTIALVHEEDLDSTSMQNRLEALRKNTKLVFKLASDRRLTVLPRIAASIGNPEIELEIPLDDFRNRVRTGEGVAGKIVGDLDIGDLEGIAKVEVEVGRKDSPRPQTRPRSNAIGSRDESPVQTRERSGAITADTLTTPETRARSNAIGNAQDASNRPPPPTTPAPDGPVDTRPRSNAIGGADDPGPSPTLTEPASQTGRIYWKATIKLGNMSIGDLLTLLRSTRGGS